MVSSKKKKQKRGFGHALQIETRWSCYLEIFIKLCFNFLCSSQFMFFSIYVLLNLCLLFASARILFGCYGPRIFIAVPSHLNCDTESIGNW